MPWLGAIAGLAGAGAGSFAGAAGPLLGGKFNYDATPYKFDPNAFRNRYTQRNQSLATGGIERYNQPLDIRAQLDLQEDQRQARAQQQAFAQTMQQQAAGKGGPSLAEMELQQNMAAALQAQRSALASAPRGSSASLARQTATNMANLHLDQTNQALMARAREQQTAQAQLGNLLAQIRESDLSGADMTNRGRIANQGLQMQSDAQRGEMSRMYLAMSIAQAEADRAARMQEQEMRAREHARTQGIDYGTQLLRNQQEQQLWSGLVGGALGGASQGMAAGSALGGGQAQSQQMPMYSNNVGSSYGGSTGPNRGLQTRIF